MIENHSKVIGACTVLKWLSNDHMNICSFGLFKNIYIYINILIYNIN